MRERLDFVHLKYRFSRSNLFSKKQRFEFYAASGNEIEKVQQLVGQIPWVHNGVIISKSETIEKELALIFAKKS